MLHGISIFRLIEVSNTFQYFHISLKIVGSRFRKETGEIFYTSDYDDVDEIPEEVYDRDDCIEIPHKNDLDLGRNLVFEFIEQYLPGDFERVRKIFRRKGAYGRYKDLLEDRGFLKRWYDFENTRRTETLREWCKDNEIKLVG
jgi:hypothetical protein